MHVDPDIKRLRKMTPGALADEAGALKARIEAIKDEMIRRRLGRAEGEGWRLSLSPPGEQNRTDKTGLLRVLGITESEFITRFTNPVHTDWVMRCTERKVPRRPVDEPVKAPRAA